MYKLVPVEPTSEMVDAAEGLMLVDVIWECMLAASPDPAADEAWVERVADALTACSLGEVTRAEAARAVLALMRGE
jgi:hypothetical protein